MSPHPLVTGALRQTHGPDVTDTLEVLGRELDAQIDALAALAPDTPGARDQIWAAARPS